MPALAAADIVAKGTENLELEIELVDEFGQPLPLGGATFTWPVSRSFDERAFTDLSNWLTVPSSPEGLARLVVPQDIVASFPAGLHVHELTAKYANGTSQDLIAGSFVIIPSIPR